MIVRYRRTLDCKASARKVLEECWEGYHELLGLVTPKQGEERWRTLAALAKATDSAPEVAKYCLNMAMLKRFRCNTGRALPRSFTVQDFVAAKKMAVTVDKALCPWDDEIAQREGTLHVCGELCAQRLQSQFMGNVRENQRSASV